MVLEMVVNATGQSWQLITLVFAIIFGLGGAMISKRADRTQAVEKTRKSNTENTPTGRGVYLKNGLIFSPFLKVCLSINEPTTGSLIPSHT